MVALAATVPIQHAHKLLRSRVDRAGCCYGAATAGRGRGTGLWCGGNGLPGSFLENWFALKEGGFLEEEGFFEVGGLCYDWLRG